MKSESKGIQKPKYQIATKEDDTGAGGQVENIVTYEVGVSG